MIDTARNFKPKEWLYKILDAMAMYKLNTLHLHLTDDEAWRLEIPVFPELTQVKKQVYTIKKRQRRRYRLREQG